MKIISFFFSSYFSTIFDYIIHAGESDREMFSIYIPNIYNFGFIAPCKENKKTKMVKFFNIFAFFSQTIIVSLM